MDATDARRVVVEICRRAGVELGRVLGRDRGVAHIRRGAMLELRRVGCSNREIAKVFGRVPGTVGEVLRPWRIGSSGRRRARVQKRHVAGWRPDHRGPHAGRVKDFAEHWAHQLRRDLGSLVHAPINLSASTGDSTLVAAVADRRIVVVDLEFCTDGDSDVDVWSGAAGTRITGRFATARGEYRVFDKITHADNTALVINRGSSVALKGSVTYRLL